MLICVWISKIPRLGGAGTEFYDPAWPLKSFPDENIDLGKTDLEGLWGPLNSNKPHLGEVLLYKPHQEATRRRQRGNFQTRQGKASKAKLRTAESIRQSKQLRGAAGSKLFCIPGQTRIWMGDRSGEAAAITRHEALGICSGMAAFGTEKIIPHQAKGWGRGQETYKLPQMISRCSGRNTVFLKSVGRGKSDWMRTKKKKKKKTNTNKQKLLRATEEFSKPETSTLEPEKLKKPWGMISPTGRTWVWASSRSWWWTRKSGVL